jgi:predicted Rossmann fold flavoprotein
MQNDDHSFQVAVIGAGAAGLVAAFRAAEQGASVILLEKNRRPGVKILMSGGTRCNLTNARGLRSLRGISGPIDPEYNPKEGRGPRAIQAAFGDNGPFLAPALRALTVEQTIDMFEAEGLPTKVEGNGKVFPASDRAVDVLAALLRRLERSGAALRTQSPALSVDDLPDRGFSIATPHGEIRVSRVIVASGGVSYPGCGTTGDGYAIARRFGHSIVEPKPALVPIRVDAPWVTDLRGLTIPDAVAGVLDAAGTRLLTRREAVLFAHFGLTGPAILDVSRAATRHENPTTLLLTLDLEPDRRSEAIDAELQTASRAGKQLVVNLLPQHLPRRLAEAVVGAVGIPLDRRGPDLSRDERRRLVAGVKGLSIPIAGTLGFAKAEVTSGGVRLDEVDPARLESLLRPGLHFIGEVLDLDGLIGGYNFQAAWSTGWLAGEVAAGS